MDPLWGMRADYRKDIAGSVISILGGFFDPRQITVCSAFFEDARNTSVSSLKLRFTENVLLTKSSELREYIPMKRFDSSNAKGLL